MTPYFFEPHRWVASSYKSAYALARLGHEVVVFTSRSTALPDLEKPLPNLTIYRFHDLFLPDPVNFGILPFLSLRLLKVIRRERPTHYLVYKHMFYTSLAVFWLKLWRKRVVLVTDTFPGVVWFSRSRLVNAVLWLGARTLGLGILRSADRVVLLHEGLLPAASRLGLRRVTVNHGGVDLERIDEARPAADLTKKEGELWITYVGRLESVKGYDVLLNAASELLEHYRFLRFLLVGPEGKTAKRSFDTSRIRFLGHREDVPGVLSASDIFVLPSFSEGLPNALMEAMAARCACVASRVGGVVSLLGDDEAGLTVPPGNREALRDALERLIRDRELRDRLANRARAVIEERYNLRPLTERLVDLLEEA